MQQSPVTEIRETYRALLARGLEPGEAANLTAFLHGLPSEDLHWSVREVEALVGQRRRVAAGASSGPADGAQPGAAPAAPSGAPAGAPTGLRGRARGNHAGRAT